MRQQIARKNKPSVSLSLNVPGFPKSNETVSRFFRICLDELKINLRANLISIIEEEAAIQNDHAGDFFIVPFLSTHMTATEIKNSCEKFEENHPLGRFLDVDIADANGNPVSSGKSKLCFYCGQKPAIECRRENAHDIDELRIFMYTKMEDYCKNHRENSISRHLSSLAMRALLYEISLTPKPGLVDKFSNGSHTDMNYSSFMNSSASISTWFADLVHEGFRFHDQDLKLALPLIRTIGLHMESDMFASTHHVNTQKGLIFLMGVSLFACGHLFARQKSFEPEKFREIVRRICKDLTHNELIMNDKVAMSHGEEVFKKYGFSGARGEAEAGFPMVFEFGLPVLLKYNELNDDTLHLAFLSIASQNDDTNILYRSDVAVLNEFKHLANKTLVSFNKANMVKLTDYCNGRNISPGGSADLLAVSILIYLVTKSDYEF